MAYKVFTNGSTLQASELNENLMQQSIAVFSNAAARTAAITSPLEGQVTFLEDQNILSIYDGSSWKTSLAPTGSVLQVVTGTTTTTTSTTATSVNTALSVSITPRSASNKILVTSYNQALLHNNLAGVSLVALRRGSTILDARADSYITQNNSGLLVPASVGILDSPNTTSAITYGTVVGSSNSSNTAQVRDRQVIIAMEIAS